MLQISETIVDLLRDNVLRRPDDVYASFNGAPFTYKQLDSESSAVAAHLRSSGVAAGDRVAVMMRNSLDAISVIFGLAKAGIVWAAVNVQQRGDGLRGLLETCMPKAVVADAELVPIVRQTGFDAGIPLISNAPASDCISLQDVFAGTTRLDQVFAPSLDAAFAFIFTSGTTGRSKAAIVSHLNAMIAAQAVLRLSGARAGDRFFVWEPLYHIGGAQLLSLPMNPGIGLSMVDRFSASQFWKQAKECGATHVHHLGGILQLLMKQPASPADRDHGIRISWGGGCPPEIWLQFEERFGLKIRECYGMTECASIATCNEHGPVGSVGKPLPWFDVAIVDEVGKVCSPGARGEIVLRSSLAGAIFPGYFNNPEATARALINGALHTGDSGSFDENGSMYFHGRINDSIRCQGENISAWEVEHVACEHPDIEDCAMVGVQSDTSEQDIKLFVKPKPGQIIKPSNLSRWLGSHLARYQNPRYIAFVDGFERTPSQRIIKGALSKQVDDCWDRLNPS